MDQISGLPDLRDPINTTRNGGGSDGRAIELIFIAYLLAIQQAGGPVLAIALADRPRSRVPGSGIAYDRFLISPVHPLALKVRTGGHAAEQWIYLSDRRGT